MGEALVRAPAVSGMFYAADKDALSAEIASSFAFAKQVGLVQADGDSKCYRAFICPHAGYVYSGGVAATAYQHLAEIMPSKIAVLGPSHRVYLQGIAAPTSHYFRTPLGDIGIDQLMINKLLAESLVKVDDAPHALEHSIEVHLPFLQTCLKEFSLLPLVVGDESPAVVANVIDLLLKNNYFIVASSDLSHFLAYDQAIHQDALTSEKILQKNTSLSGEEACGCRVLNGLLTYAGEHGWCVDKFSQLNSGDTAGDKSRVVGYAAFGLGYISKLR